MLVESFESDVAVVDSSMLNYRREIVDEELSVPMGPLPHPDHWEDAAPSELEAALLDSMSSTIPGAALLIAETVHIVAKTQFKAFEELAATGGVKPMYMPPEAVAIDARYDSIANMALAYMMQKDVVLARQHLDM